jgi:hypothetical protein
MELGLRRFVDDMRTGRHRFRQATGAVFLAFLVVLARPTGWGFGVGLALACLGGFVRLWAAGLVHKNVLLETGGPYAVVRHPQYLGNTLIGVGLCLASGHPWALLVWALILYVFYLPAMRHEDQKLHGRFGEAWEQWSAVTPSLIPRRPPSGSEERRQWSLMQSVRNGEPIWLGIVFAGFLLVYLQLP